MKNGRPDRKLFCVYLPVGVLPISRFTVKVPNNGASFSSCLSTEINPSAGSVGWRTFSLRGFSELKSLVESFLVKLQRVEK